MIDNYQVDDAPERLTLTCCTVDVETTPHSVSVTVSGQLDVGDAGRVGEVLAEAARLGRPLVRVQLAGLTFGDSSALKALLRGAKAADEHGVTYELVNPSGVLRRVLEVTGLTEILAIIDEPDQREGPAAL